MQPQSCAQKGKETPVSTWTITMATTNKGRKNSTKEKGVRRYPLALLKDTSVLLGIWCVLAYYTVWDPPLHLFFDPISIESIKDEHRSIYIPGTGFLGFWFLLGRLQSIPSAHDHNYYCYSSGCLAVVCSLLNSTTEDVINMTSDIQRRWQGGEMSRFQVVEEFVDGLIPPTATVDDIIDENMLERLYIMTATRGIGANVRQPRSATELKELLIQTTWIPFVTGWGWWRKDQDGSLHIDGGFSSNLFPQLNTTLNTPSEYMMEIQMNTFNVNLAPEQVQKYWQAGFIHGVF